MFFFKAPFLRSKHFHLKTSVFFDDLFPRWSLGPRADQLRRSYQQVCRDGRCGLRRDHSSTPILLSTAIFLLLVSDWIPSLYIKNGPGNHQGQGIWKNGCLECGSAWKDAWGVFEGSENFSESRNPTQKKFADSFFLGVLKFWASESFFFFVPQKRGVIDEATIWLWNFCYQGFGSLIAPWNAHKTWKILNNNTCRSK